MLPSFRELSPSAEERHHVVVRRKRGKEAGTDRKRVSYVGECGIRIEVDPGITADRPGDDRAGMSEISSVKCIQPRNRGTGDPSAAEHAPFPVDASTRSMISVMLKCVNRTLSGCVSSRKVPVLFSYCAMSQLALHPSKTKKKIDSLCHTYSILRRKKNAVQTARLGA